MVLGKQESLPFEEPASEKPPMVFKEKPCPICGFDLGDNPENCRACQHEVIKKKRKGAAL